MLGIRRLIRRRLSYTLGKTHTMKRHFLKILLPPILPMLIIASVAIFSFISEGGKPVDTVDDAVRFSSILLIVFTPILYFFYLVINGIDYMFDVRFPSSRWSCSFIYMIVLGLLAGVMIYTPGVDYDVRYAVLAGVGFPLIVILPMSIWRRTSWNVDPELQTDKTVDMTRKPSLS